MTNKFYFRKLMTNLLSVKVWIIFAVLIISSILCWFQTLNGTEFATLNGGIVSTVLAVREGIKYARITNGNGNNEDNDI